MMVLAAVLVAMVGRPAVAQYHAYVDRSEKAEVLLRLARQYLSDGRFDLAVPLLVEALETSADAVLPETGQGAYLAIRKLVLDLPPQPKALYLEAVEPAAKEALAVAERGDSIAARSDVVRRFPGTVAARSVAERLWAASFEQGNFQQTVERVGAYLDDPMVAGPKRRLALAVLGVAAAAMGQRDTAADAVAQLEALPDSGPLALCGQAVNPVAHIQAGLKQPVKALPVWTNVGGTPERNAVGRSGLSFAACSVLLGDKPTPRKVADRRELLQRKTFQPDRASESIVLATPRSYVVASGGRMAAYQRTSGRRRWHLPDLQSSESLLLSPIAARWPSCGDGHVAAMCEVQPELVSRQPGRVRVPANGDGKAVLAVMAEETGRLAWLWPAPEDDADQPPGDRAAVLHDLEPAGSPLVYGGRVFVAAARRPMRNVMVDCYLVCFNLPTGEVLWRRFVGSGPMGSMRPASHTLDRMIPVTDGRRVYVESAAETITAVDLATGAVAWSRSFNRPVLQRRELVSATQWPAAVTDAPTAVGGRLCFTSVFGPRLRCLDAADGRTLWEIRTPPGWRLGVYGGALYFAAGSVVVGYELAGGDECFRTALPAEAVGPGFVAGDAVFLPTTVGAIRIGLPEGAVSVVSAPREQMMPSRALVPLGPLILSAGADELRVFGAMDDLVADARGNLDADSDYPGCGIRLADLHRQKGAFAEAEKLLLAAARQAASATDMPSADLLKLQADSGLVSLYRDWAAELRRRGRVAEAWAKLNQGRKLAGTPADCLLADAALAEHCHAVRDVQEAGKRYRAIAAQDEARRTLMPTGVVGLRRTLASQAELALEQLNAGSRPSPEGPGVARDDLDRLVVAEVAELSWDGPSHVLNETAEAFAPLLWVRPDGLAALGPAGQVRWVQQSMRGADDNLPWVATRGTMAVVCSTDALVARDLLSGDVRWQWQPPQGGALRPAVPAGDFVRARAVRRACPADVATVLAAPSQSVFGEQAADCLVTDAAVVTVSRGENDSGQVLHSVPLSKGETSWSTPLPDGFDVRGLASQPGRTLVALHAADGRFIALCFAESHGGELWRHELAVPRGRKLRCLFQGGLFVTNDSAGQCVVLDAADAQVRCRGRFDGRWMPGAVPVAVAGDAVIFCSDHGYLAVSSANGRILWRSDVAEGVRRAASPLVFGGKLLTWVGDEVVACDVTRGRQLWRRKIAGAGSDGLGIAVCGDMVLAYGRKPLEPRAVLLDLAGGELVGEILLRPELTETTGGDVASPDVGGRFLDVVAIRGGFFAQWGEQLLAVVRGEAAGPDEGIKADRPREPADEGGVAEP